jgi:hypothetical protein
MFGGEHVIIDMLKTSGGRAVVGVLMVAVGAGFWLLADPQLSGARALRAQAQRATAEVTDSRVTSDVHGVGKHYDIRYRFRLRPHGTWYTRAEKGPRARQELWTTLEKPAWDVARRTSWIEIEYLPSDPSVNCPVGHACRRIQRPLRPDGLRAAADRPGRHADRPLAQLRHRTLNPF